MAKPVFFDGFEDADLESTIESQGYKRVNNVGNADYVIYKQDPHRHPHLLPRFKKDVALVNMRKSLTKKGWIRL